MDYKYITDIKHLFSDDSTAAMSDDTLAYRTFLGHLIGAATVTDDVEFQSAVPCRKIVIRKPCPGFIRVFHQSLPVTYLNWHCSVCDDGGKISGWRGCPFDQCEFPEVPYDDGEPNPLVEVAITREEMKAILDRSCYDPDSERIIYRARPDRQKIMLRGLYGDMDNFVGFLASDANHETDKKRAKLLDSAFEKIESATSRAYEEAGMGAE